MPQLALSLPRFAQTPLQSARPGAHDEQQRNPVSGYEKSCASVAAMKLQPKPTEKLSKAPPRMVYTLRPSANVPRRSSVHSARLPLMSKTAAPASLGSRFPDVVHWLNEPTVATAFRFASAPLHRAAS